MATACPLALVDIFKSHFSPNFLKFHGKLVHSLLQLSERWPCYIWPVGRMKFASLEANLVWGQGF